MMRVVGSAEPPGGKPTTRRMGLTGYCATAAPAAAIRTSASAVFDSLSMAASQVSLYICAMISLNPTSIETP